MDLSFLCDKNGNFIPVRVTEKYIFKNHTKLYEEILAYGQNNMAKTWQQRFYNYIANLKTMPMCPICGVNVRSFKRVSMGYNETCSDKKCKYAQSGNSIRLTVSKDDPIKRKKISEKRKKTNNERYGFDYTAQVPEIRDRIKRTNNMKYDVDYPLQSRKIRLKTTETFLKNAKPSKLKGKKRPIDIMEKVKKTNMKNHNVPNLWSLPEMREKIKNTHMERYNVEYAGQSELVKKKMRDTLQKNNTKAYAEKYPNFNIVKYENRMISILCSECNTEYDITPSLLFQRVNTCKINPCLNCNPLDSHFSAKEHEISKILGAIYNGKIILHARNIINGELDIYLPDDKIAIEYNGLYWHSELFKDKLYHLRKTEECEAAGIRLIHIFEDEFMYMREIVFDIIMRRLRITDKYEKKYARECFVRKLSFSEAKAFFSENHIQGNMVHSICYGLVYDEHIISAMSFGRVRGNGSSSDRYEMYRYCTKIGYIVTGAAERLFSAFVKEIMPAYVISYADRRLFDGKIYEKLGFKNTGKTGAGYFYIVNGMRVNRFNYRKGVLVKEGYDKNKSEFEIMSERGIYRVFDCGHLKYEWVRHQL